MIIDANIILRCILNDNVELANKAKFIIENNDCFAPTEVLAEVVYVLQKVYGVSRCEIANLLSLSFRYYATENEMLLKNSLTFYSQTKLDFVDCILASRYFVSGEKISTLDRKLENFIERL
jgi:predicted nucleic-acid-binding protein